MFLKPAQDKAAKSARCKACRRCYNSGLCLMPWPGFGPTAPERPLKNDNHNPPSGA